MKLAACRSKTRRTDATDWTDIIDLCRLHSLNPETDTEFRDLVLRYGQKELLEQLISAIKSDEAGPRS